MHGEACIHTTRSSEVAQADKSEVSPIVQQDRKLQESRSEDQGKAGKVTRSQCYSSGSKLRDQGSRGEDGHRGGGDLVQPKGTRHRRVKKGVGDRSRESPSEAQNSQSG